MKAVGTFAWIPPVAAGIGCLFGGGVSSWLLHRGHSVNRARKIILGISAFLMPFVLFVPAVPVSWAIALFSLAYFGHQWWSTLVMILPTDLFPKNVVGAVAGLVGCAVPSAESCSVRRWAICWTTASVGASSSRIS